ncbi:putative nucleotide-binding alpha-beta plait domain superfamily, RNA-binding domain superfamily [Helianthus anomalus]
MVLWSKSFFPLYSPATVSTRRRFCNRLQELRFCMLLLMILCFKLPKHGGGSTKSGNFNHGNRTMNNRTNMAQREDVIRTTICVLDIDQEVTEEQFAALFFSCVQVVDFRIYGDPNTHIHLAFIEFTDEGMR